MPSPITTRNKVLAPAQVTPLSRDLVLLRKVNFKKLDGSIAERLAFTNLEPGMLEMDMPWWSEGYIANDQPHDMLVVDAVMGATRGFAIARTDTGEIIRRYKTDQLGEAERALARAKPSINVDISLDDEPIDDDEEDEDEPAENLEDE